MNFYYSVRLTFLLTLFTGSAGMFKTLLQAQTTRSSAQKEIKLFDPTVAAGSNISLRAIGGTASYVLQLPSVAPVANQVLGVSSVNAGVANLFWTNSSSGNGNGLNGQITYWSGSSSQAGSQQLFWDIDNNRMGIGTSSPSEKLTITEPTSADLDVSMIARGADYLKSQLTFAVKGDNSSLVGGAIGSAGNREGGLILNGNTGDISVSTPHFLLKTDGEILINKLSDLGNYKLQIDGDLASKSARFTDVISGGYSSNLGLKNDGTLTKSSSDFRLKKSIETISNPLEKVMALRGVTYNWKDSTMPKRMMGMIAQEVMKVAPELVFQNEGDGYYGILYGETSGLLVEAIKEQQKLIQDLNISLGKLKQEYQKLLNDVDQLTNQIKQNQ